MAIFLPLCFRTYPGRRDESIPHRSDTSEAKNGFCPENIFHRQPVLVRILCIPSAGVISVSFCHLSDVPEIARPSPLLQIRPPPITHTIIRGAITQGGKKDGDGQCFVVRGKRTGTRTDCKILLSSFFRRTESQTISKVFFWTLKLRQCFCWCDN